MSKKSGFLRFIFSLIPGAGEMYMGFMKQGVTLMVLFWGTIFFGGCLNVPLIMFPLPVIWAYSFFHVHNLAGLSDEEFYAQEDSLLFDWNLFGQIEPKKGRKILAWVLIFIGVSVLWNFMKGMVFMVLLGSGYAVSAAGCLCVSDDIPWRDFDSGQEEGAGAAAH